VSRNILVILNYLKTNTMKKLITLIAVLFISAPAYAQTKKVDAKVTVKEEQTAAQIIQNAQRIRSERMEAEAARAAAMSEPKNDVITPLTVDLYDYTHIAIVGATCSGSSKPKGCYNLISDGFKLSALTVINPVDYDKKKFKENPAFLRTIKNPDWVYVTYKKSIQGVDEIRTLTIRDYQNKVLYKVNTRNISADEVYSVLTDM
jgi:hypothetical protein